MNLQLPEETQALIAAQIKAGRSSSAEEYIQHLVEKDASTNTTPAAPDAIPEPLAPPEGASEWVKQLYAWANSQTHGNGNVDDSRESIYAGCGE